MRPQLYPALWTLFPVLCTLHSALCAQDADRSGKVDLHEFVGAMRQLNIPADPRAVAAVFRAADRDGSGQ